MSNELIMKKKETIIIIANSRFSMYKV